MFAFFISFRLFQPMEKILESVRTMNLTEEEKGALLLGKNELETILTSIQKSGSSLRALDKELKNRIYALKKAQTIALQAQINPHFLNNTLETMNWMALTQLGRKNEISEMATDLSNLLRIALDQSETMIPIRTEIEYCKCYLGIQLKRYEDRFDVIWEIDSQILDCKIIKMVLQPLVENAIYHGIKPMAGKGKITISCCLKDNSVLLSVSDNGIGMTEQSLWALRNMLAKDSIPADDHIGLANVNQRLRLFFGSDCGLEIESTPQDRTTVHFRIPIS